MTYQWADTRALASFNAQIEAQVVGEHLESLRQKNGGELTPLDVVQDAKRKASPLHDAFEWDDASAAHRYRIEQARMMVRAIVVLQPSSTGEVKTIRAFVSVKGEEADNVYVSIGAAMADPGKRQQVLGKAFAELRSWEKRYKAYQEFSEVFSAIESVAPTLALEPVEANV